VQASIDLAGSYGVGEIIPPHRTVIAPGYRQALAVAFTSHGEHLFNLANPTSPGTLAGTAPFAGSPIGKVRAFRATAADGSIWYPTTSNAVDFSVLVHINFRDAASVGGFLQWTSGTTLSFGSPRLLVQSNSGQLRLYWSSAYVISESTPLTAGSSHAILVTVTGSTVTLYRNGRQIGTYTNSGTNTGTHLHFGNGFSQSAGCNVALGAWWERTLTPTEALALTANPARLLEPEPIQIYWSSIGGSTLIDLTASSFRFTGQSIQPKTTVNLSTNSNFLFSSKTIQTSLVSRLSAATFRFTANSIAVGGQTIIDLSRATFNFVGKAINTIQNTAIQLGAASFRFIGNSITVTGAIAAVKRGGGMMMMLARKLTRRYRDKIGKHE